MYWDMPRPLTGPAYERVAELVRGNCALYSNHLPLDGHPELGNNALLAAQLGWKKHEPFLLHEGESIGRIVRTRLKRSDLRTKLEKLYPRVVAIECGSAELRAVAPGESRLLAFARDRDVQLTAAFSSSEKPLAVQFRPGVVVVRLVWRRGRGNGISASPSAALQASQEWSNVFFDG